jgi:hypothetical protein
MPTFSHGKNAVFKLDNSAGSLIDISDVVNDVTVSRAIETGETTSFGNSSKTYIVGLADATISVSGSFDTTVDAHLTGTIGALLDGTLASASFEAGPQGTANPNVKYTGEALITSYEVNPTVGDVVTFTMDLQVTGAVTRGTYA